MEFTDTRTYEAHTAYASATITDAETMEDLTTRYVPGEGNRPVRVPFTPDRAAFRWRWDGTLGWVLVQIRVSGLQIKKDGTPGAKTRTVSFVQRGEVLPTTPSALITLADELAPKSQVVEP